MTASAHVPGGQPRRRSREALRDAQAGRPDGEAAQAAYPLQRTAGRSTNSTQAG